MISQKTGEKINFEKIELLVLDVDGVMTDGSLVFNGDGSESKVFSALDGHGIRMWRRAGLKIAFLSGRFSEPTEKRAKNLEVDYVFQNCHNKTETMEKLLEDLSLTYERVAFVGDDLMDMPVIRRAAVGVAVSNAVDEVKQVADYITNRKGGQGAVREVIEFILKNSFRWEKLIERYSN